jgi:hypothetical protein
VTDPHVCVHGPLQLIRARGALHDGGRVGRSVAQLAEVHPIAAAGERDDAPRGNPVTAPRMTMPDEELNRAIALLDEQSIEAFRRKIAKKRAKNAAKPARRKK